MAEEPENLTIRLLQEMRSEMRDVRTDIRDIRAEIKEMHVELTEKIADVKRGVDGNSVLIASLAGYLHDHEERITALEAGRPRPV